MNFREILHNSYHILEQNKMRSFLTMLGIIIGIMGVIVIISAGAGAQSLIFNQIKSQGSNLVAIFPGSGDKEGPPVSVMGIVITTLKYDDILALKDPVRSPDVSAVTGYVRGSETVTWQGNKTDTSIIGVSATLPEVEDTGVAVGDFFSEEDELSLAKSAVLGADTYKDLFGEENAVGQLVKIGKHNFRVVGVMKARGATGFTNQDKQIYVPITTAQKLLLGINYVSFGRVKVTNEERIDGAMLDIQDILRERHNLDPGVPDDFDVRSQKEALDTLLTVTNAMKFFLAAIAGISLIVGGIGIMNIMLVAVQERIREIGLRKAVGARNSQIMVQFLVETIFITFLSGIIGVILGVGVTYLIARIVQYLGYDWQFIVSGYSLLLAVGVATAIGFVSGLIPARRASRLNPIEALQYE